MPEQPERTMYVAVWNNRPIGVSAHLGDAQAAAVARENKYSPNPPEHRWEQDSGDDSWQLLVLTAQSGRWNRRLVFVYPTPVVDAPSA